MIGVPFDVNDLGCLGSITQEIVALVAARPADLLELGHRYPTTAALAAWIRTLPQRDDEGLAHDGPKVQACAPPQRLRIPADDPNCVERAALYIAVAELIDPVPARQLATLDFDWGRHVVPLEYGVPIVLNPGEGVGSMPDAAVEVEAVPPESHAPRRRKRAPVAVDINDAIDYTTQLAESGAAQTRNGPNRAYLARNAIRRLIDEGVPPANEHTIDALGWFFAQAEAVARQYGSRALTIVRTTAQAIADLVDDVLASRQRNLSFEVNDRRFTVPSWLSGLGALVGRVGLNVGALYAAPKLAALGVSAEMLNLVEQELNADGLTLGPLANANKSFTSALGSLSRRTL